MSDSESENAEDMEWLVHEYKKRKRKKNCLSEEDLLDIIGTSQPGPSKNSSLSQKQKSNSQHKNTTQTNTNKNTSVINYSPKMQTITNQQYKLLYYVTTYEDMSRTNFADIWSKHQQNSSDIILKTKKGFLIKSNSAKTKIKGILTGLQKTKTIKTFEETHPNQKQQNESFTATFVCVIASVEREIDDKHISDYLTSKNINHRYCKRIKSRSTQDWTTLIRIITGDIQSFEKLLNEGVYYKFRHYPVFPSKPPEPIPIPCAKCSGFTHTTENCTVPITCRKCQGKHHTNACESSLPPKCVACNSTEHQAWSMKCPKRPTTPIEGIPNTQIKSINKKSQDIDINKTKNNKIHKPLTYHDYIIETYVTELNNPNNTDRQELLLKLKKRFTLLHGIDTTAVFCGNRLYILMFDLNDTENKDSPTEPIDGVKIHQEEIQNGS